MSIANLWKEYCGYADEREEAEANRISRRAFNAMVVLNLLLAYFLMQVSQVAMVHNLDSSPYEWMSPIASVLCVFVIVTCVYSASQQTRKGIMSQRFSHTETFPVTDGIAIAALSAGVVAIALWVLRCVTEIMLAGVGEVYWLGNLAIAAFFFVVLCICIFAALYLVFKDAKKAQAKLLAELDEE